MQKVFKNACLELKNSSVELFFSVFYVMSVLVDIAPKTWKHLHKWVLEASGAINRVNNEKIALV